jgi:F0F1-type ATP synthase membrane subunit b/b'
MTTTEKRGFRLPWGSDNRKSDDDSEATPDGAGSEAGSAEPIEAATDLAPAIAATSNDSHARSGSGLRRGQADDLGRGPFDLQPMPEPEAPAAAADTPAAEPAAPAASAAEPVAPADGLVAWPDIDRAGSATHLASDAPPPPRPAVIVEGDAPASPRRTNPLMAGLVKAMRDAARSARDEATTKMRSDAAARLVELRTQSATVGLTLKKQADEDVAGIREWSKAETARIRTETDERIAKRRTELVSEVEDHTAESQRLQAEVNGAIATFDAEMERFFDILLKEDDPARLATLAERLPEAPSFARPMGAAGAPTPRPRAARAAGQAAAATPRQRTGTAARRKPSERLAPDAAAAAEAEAIAGLDDTPAAAVSEPGLAPEPAVAVEVATEPVVEAVEAELEPEAEPRLEPEPDAPAGSLANVLAAAPRIDSPDDLSPEERIALLGFDEPEPAADGTEDDSPAPVLGVPLEPDGDAHAHSAAARAAATPLEDVTRVVVTGLSSVAGISAFKSALGSVTGVVSVSVTSGMDHDFVFSVVHADATDLRRAVAAFPAFAAQMTLDEGAVVNFIVSEPAT